MSLKAQHSVDRSISTHKHLEKLLVAQELSAWRVDNEFIRSAYRPASGSIGKSFASLFRMHNQTINAYSHLVGALVFCGLPFVFYHKDYVNHPRSKTGDLVVLSLYCLGVAVCFTISAIFHVLENHSCTVSRVWNRLDYVGVIILMWAAGVSTIFYGFVCDRKLRLFYCATTSVSALFCVLLTLTPHFDSPRFRTRRAVLYATFGLSSATFVIHGLVLHGWEVQRQRMSLVRMGGMATMNLLGAMIYAARVPERWAPYTFDVVGASHQIFHIAVVVAGWVHYLALLESFHNVRDSNHSCALPAGRV